MANPNHIAKIHDGALAWNQWRTRFPFEKIKLASVKLSGRKLTRINLNAADLSRAVLHNADFSGANLSGADLRHANLSYTDLTGADLTGADLRSANLQYASLDRCWASDVKLWETQRARWSVKGLLCERAFWDEDAKEATTYKLGEFELRHSDRTRIEMLYPGGISSFELSTLPALIHHLASLLPGSTLRLSSIEETAAEAGGARLPNLHQR